MSQDQPRSAPRRVAGRVKRSATEVAGRGYRFGSGAQVRATRALHRRSLVPGLLSVVVPCYNVEDYLDECLVSLRFQDYRKVEIIVVDDGSPDRSVDIARAHRRRDPRVRMVQRENGGLSAARNTGRRACPRRVHRLHRLRRRAPAAWLRRPAGGTAELAAPTSRSRSYDRIEKTSRKRADVWIRRAHATRGSAPTSTSSPTPWSTPWPGARSTAASSGTRPGSSFPEGRLYEDQPVSMAAYGRARAFDVVPEIGVSWRIRHDRSSISQASNTVRNLRAHTEAVRSSLDALLEAGRSSAAQHRALQILANNMPFFMRHVLRADAEYWDLLGEAVGDLVHTIPEEVYRREVDSHNKVLYALVMSGRLEDARALLLGFGTDARGFDTEVTPDGVRSLLPLPVGVPEEAAYLSERQLEMFARALRVALGPDGELRVDGWAYVQHVDMVRNAFTLEVDLVGPDESRVPMVVTGHPEPLADLVANHDFCDYRPGGFTATLETSSLPEGGGPWEVRATLTPPARAVPPRCSTPSRAAPRECPASCTVRGPRRSGWTRRDAR